MNYYEMLYIINPNFERKKIDDIMKEIENRLNKTKSQKINHVIWGKKKLAYTIKGHKYGTYILAHYNGGDKKALDEFNSWLKLSDLVIRHMIVRLDNKPDVIEITDNELSLESKNEESSLKEESENEESSVKEESENEESSVKEESENEESSVKEESENEESSVKEELNDSKEDTTEKIEGVE